MAKKQHHEEHENHERWLVSYADFITLLFAFFVVMYAVSRVDNKKLTQATESIKFAMHFQGSGGVTQMQIFEGPPSQGGCQQRAGFEKATEDELKMIDEVRKKLAKRLQDFLQSRPDAKNSLTVHFEGRKLTVRLSAAHFFDPSQAAIRPEVVPVLDAIAAELASLRRPIRVEGHTDDTPVGGSRFRDNWELSSSRAASVASYLQRAHAIEGRFLGAAGYAATRPIALNTTVTGREANRRVEMVVELAPGDALEPIAK